MRALGAIAQQLDGNPDRPCIPLSQPGSDQSRLRELSRARRPKYQAVLRLDQCLDIGTAQSIFALGSGASTASDQSAQLTVTLAIGREHDQWRTAVETEFGTDDEAGRRTLECRMGPYHARHRTLVGDRERRVAEFERARRQLLGLRGAAQETEAAQAMQLGIPGQIGDFRGGIHDTVYIYSI